MSLTGSGDNEITAFVPTHESDDYGSDWGEDGETLLAELLENAESLVVEAAPLLPDVVEHGLHHFAVVPLRSDPALHYHPAAPQIQIRRRLSVPHDESRGNIRFEKPETVADGTNDTRTPLERFRTSPKKPLSVTDLVSPAWCELQYWYNLTKFGKKLQTPAMQRGSSVHKILEEQVHQVVPIDVQTREDHWGLRMWNVIQGLRTLRVTGMTRELEVWGTIDGLVVNGVIDELSYTCTDPDLEAAILKEETKAMAAINIPADQKTISEFFASQTKDAETTIPSGQAASRASQASRQHQALGKVYLTDVKTRNHKSLPKGASLRPTHMQLMIYHTLLSRLACDQVDATKVFERYRVHPTVSFSDSLIAQLGNLDLNLKGDADFDSMIPVESQTDAVSELLGHNNLATLWTLMIREFQATFPRGKDSISKVIRAEFRSSTDGNVIGAKTFVHRDQDIEAYVADELDWWRGKRKARGVEIEEAFKCRICEHAEGCEWRINKIQEATENARRRQTSKKGLS